MKLKNSHVTPPLNKRAVSCRFSFCRWLFGCKFVTTDFDKPSEKDWLGDKRKYTIVNPDEYDKEYGITVELGIYSVEEYYYIKGWTLGQQASQSLHSNIE